MSDKYTETVPLCANCSYLECKDIDAMNDTYYCKNYCTGELL